MCDKHRRPSHVNLRQVLWACSAGRLVSSMIHAFNGCARTDLTKWPNKPAFFLSSRPALPCPPASSCNLWSLLLIVALGQIWRNKPHTISFERCLYLLGCDRTSEIFASEGLCHIHGHRWIGVQYWRHAFAIDFMRGQRHLLSALMIVVCMHSTFEISGRSILIFVTNLNKTIRLQPACTRLCLLPPRVTRKCTHVIRRHSSLELRRRVYNWQAWVCMSHSK